MNWFDASGLTSLAKTALKEAQKTIDKALDIQDESGEEPEPESPAAANPKSSPSNSDSPQHDNTDFFSSWGLSVSAEGSKDSPIKEQPVVTESPSKATTQSMWGSFAGSFFEHPKTDDSTIVQPPKAKSMNVISDSKYGSQDDLFSKSQLVMSDGAESLDLQVRKSSKDEFSKTDERRGSSRSYRLSLVSSRNSSDSVEVLSQSLKTTPDSEAASGQSVSHSSSIGQKLNSDSVEILPDSLISPSSIECLGFDSYSSDKTTSPGLSQSTGDISDKKSTPVGDRTERADTADSVSLVADDDEDTMSYNSISECTAPTVLDTDEKSASPFPRSFRSESKLNKILDKEFIHLEPSVLPVRMQISENSSNDGSWSDRTLNADNDSISLENAVEEPKKETEQEDNMLIEKLSDSSSFYNVNVSGEMLGSESSAFVNVEKQQCSGPESESSQKEGSVKERTSPISSDSKSDLVKIGSDRTSGHTSGDDLETATSSDIEIIPSPNGDNGHFCRSSPAKYGFKHSKFDGTTSPNLVDLVLGKSLATKIRGHNRELSEASVQSNTSDESQGSENERLMRRLCEMTEILEARENRLMEVSRSNAELAENNAELKTQLETLASKHETGDISTITEEYTQRMSALEKKFQQAIREKDHLRKQLDTLKSESCSRKNSSELENVLKEKDEVIGQLQEEGEKLARQQLQHSNIIKKLRAREKDQEQLIKSLKDKISEQTSEIERLKRSVAAKEELEVNQIEAVYRLTTANKKMDAELVETKSALNDATQRLESTRTSLEAARKELASLRGGSAELQRLRTTQAQLEEDLRTARDEAERRMRELQQLRAEMVAEERRWASREEALRYEVRCARELSHAEPPALGDAAAALLHQLAALQRAALERDTAHAQHTRALRLQLDEAEASLVKAVERERVSREEAASNLERLSAAEGLLQDAQTRLEALTGQCRQLLGRAAEVEKEYASKVSELESTITSRDAEVSELSLRARGLQAQLEEARAQLDIEKKRNTILQEQMPSRGDVSPPHSVASDTFSNSMWPLDEGSITPTGLVQSALGVEDALSALTRKEGSARALAAQLQAALAARNHACGRLAQLQAELSDYQGLKEQYDALLQMYGEKEEALGEARLDLHDVTQLYKQQLDELVRLKQQVANSQR